jgi:hypothetical protein
MGAGNDPQELVARLARLLAERQDLIIQIERGAAAGAPAAAELHARLEELTHEQQRVVAGLKALVPPADGPASGPAA